VTTREAISRAQIALHEQNADANQDVIAFFDQLANTLGYIEDAKRYVDRVHDVVAAGAPEAT